MPHALSDKRKDLSKEYEYLNLLFLLFAHIFPFIHNSSPKNPRVFLKVTEVAGG